MMPIVFVPGRECLLSNYARAVRRAGGIPRFSLTIADGVGCAGLLLPGGGDLDPALYGQPNRGSHIPDRAMDGFEQALLHRFTALGAPVLGICRGCQAINVFFGGTLHQDIAGHSQIGNRDRLHPVEAAPGSVTRALFGPSFVVNSAHHQAVDRLGEGISETARAEDGTLESLRHETLPVWGVQWHPERLSAEEGGVEGGAVFAWFLNRCREYLQENS